MKNYRNTEVMENALLKMPSEFTSNEFCLKLREMGISKDFTSSGSVGDFLKRKCNQSNYSKRTWQKSTKNTQSEMTIESAIRLLKSEGYRVLMPINEWKEL